MIEKTELTNAILTTRFRAGKSGHPCVHPCTCNLWLVLFSGFAGPGFSCAFLAIRSSAVGFPITGTASLSPTNHAPHFMSVCTTLHQFTLLCTDFAPAPWRDLGRHHSVPAHLTKSDPTLVNL